MLHLKPVKVILLLLFLGSSVFAQSQNQRLIRGKLVDELELSPLKNGVIMILQAQDSIKKSHTRVRTDGSFEMPLPAPGSYILWASFPDYADYVTNFSIDSGANSHDFQFISMKLKAKLLEEVLISGIEAIKIKGDTTEFDPRAFVIEPHSKVEDLIRQFPGIQVDANGNITAHGKRVTKVLVDGEEFFGDDPTLVTRNLRGDMISKVQLYEKKSEQADFTGVDDGVRTTTLNMVLKEDKKKGYFGKVDGGLGTNDMYASQGMINLFNHKKRWAANLTVGNAGRTGLNFNDAQNFGGVGLIMMEGGGLAISGSFSDELEDFEGRFSGRGIPEVASGGIHFANKWNNDRRNINANYKLGQLGVEGTSQSISQNLLPTGTIHQQSDQLFESFMSRHKFDGYYEHEVDSSSSLRMTWSLTSRKGENRDENASLSLNDTFGKLNEGYRKSVTDSRNEVLNGGLIWRKRLAKAGRSMSANFNFNYAENTSDGQLYSNNTFYTDNEVVDSVQMIDQKKLSENTGLTLGTTFTYNEPINTKSTLVLTYGFNLQNGINHVRSLDADVGGRYTLMDSLFSNNFKLDQRTQQLGATYSYRLAKQTLNIGGRVSNVSYQQKDRYTSYDFSRSFFNFNPSVYWTYRPKTNQSITLQYNGNNQQPGIQQLQPVRSNTDPLNLYEGNLDLKPSFGHSFNMNFSSYKSLVGQSIYGSGGYTLTQNPIVTNRVTDSVGRSTTSAINLMGYNNQRYNMYLNFSRPVTKHKVNVQTGVNLSGSNNYSMVNAEVSTNVNASIGPNLGLSHNKQSKYSISLNFNPTYNFSQSSIQRQQNNNGWSLGTSYNFTIYLPYKTTFYLYGNYQWNQATQAFAEDFSLLNMTAMLERSFFKDKSLKLRLSGYDLFDQNQGFSRNANASYISQNQYTTLRRYFMAMLIWDFNKMGTQASN
jgi:hypothetical protein